MTLAVGTMNFGRRTPEPEARRIVEVALARGLTQFDTANLYGDGDSERILGRALGPRRSDVQLTTKVGAWRNEGLSHRRIVASLGESLERLGTDHVEALLLHAPDDLTPIDQTLDGIAEALSSGRAKAWGVSNHAAWRIAELNHRCAQRGLPAPSHSQVLYNLAVRQLDLEYFAFTRAHPITTTVYNPLAGGLFAHLGQPLASNARLKVNGLYKRRYGSQAMTHLAQQFESVARDAGLTLITLAYAWLNSRPGVDVVLVGPASVAHLEAALEAQAVTLTSATLERIDELHREFSGTEASYAR